MTKTEAKLRAAIRSLYELKYTKEEVQSIVDDAINYINTFFKYENTTRKH